jgi:hypothetical protein
MKLVYCDSGGYRKELRDLENSGLLQLFTYAYENSTRKIRARAPGSNPSWDEGDSVWDDDTGPWDDYATVSDHWPLIVNLIGASNLRDAKHLDSAYLAGCDAFLTSDQDDIASKAQQIFELLHVKVFHATKDWAAFRLYVENATGL